MSDAPHFAQIGNQINFDKQLAPKGELLNYIKDFPVMRVTERNVLSLEKQVLLGFGRLRATNILHEDFKMGNLLGS